MALTPKQKEFLETYIGNGYNGTRAWIDTYTTNNEASAANSASKLLKRQEALDYIRELQHDRFQQLSINADSIANELSKIAYGKVGEDCTENGKLKAIDLLQKQLGLQNQKIEAKVEETVITVGVDED